MRAPCKYGYHRVVNKPFRADAWSLSSWSYGVAPAPSLSVACRVAVSVVARIAPQVVVATALLMLPPQGAAAAPELAAAIDETAAPSRHDRDGVSVTDDAGRRIHLSAPARRVITLSPALTEMVFAAGGGDRLIGTVEYSNYPAEALAVPRIGDALALQMERILSLKPDLILAWQRGNNPRQLERLADLGLPIYYSHVERLEDVAATLERLGVLLASPAQGAADEFRRRLADLGPPARGSLPVRVFYQVWAQPLMTVNGKHVISDLIERCGGVNVFAGESLLVPVVNVEAAVAAAPEAIIAAARGAAPEDDSSLAHWRRHGSLPAVARGFLFLVDGDAISRATPRLLDAGETICRQLEQVRRAR
jgi:iron complex transport system substrate-binding protein